MKSGIQHFMLNRLRLRRHGPSPERWRWYQFPCSRHLSSLPCLFILVDSRSCASPELQSLRLCTPPETVARLRALDDSGTLSSKSMANIAIGLGLLRCRGAYSSFLACRPMPRGAQPPRRHQHVAFLQFALIHASMPCQSCVQSRRTQQSRWQRQWNTFAEIVAKTRRSGEWSGK